MAKVKALRNFFFGKDENCKRVNFTKGEVYTVPDSKVGSIEAGSLEIVKDEAEKTISKPKSK